MDNYKKTNKFQNTNQLSKEIIMSTSYYKSFQYNDRIFSAVF